MERKFDHNGETITVRSTLSADGVKVDVLGPDGRPRITVFVDADTFADREHSPVADELSEKGLVEIGERSYRQYVDELLPAMKKIEDEEHKTRGSK
jgi:hypothetical protein